MYVFIHVAKAGAKAGANERVLTYLFFSSWFQTKSCFVCRTAYQIRQHHFWLRCQNLFYFIIWVRVGSMYNGVKRKSLVFCYLIWIWFFSLHITIVHTCTNKKVYKDDKIVIGHAWPCLAMNEKRPWPMTVQS